jgi:hypothetical protein
MQLLWQQKVPFVARVSANGIADNSFRYWRMLDCLRCNFGNSLTISCESSAGSTLRFRLKDIAGHDVVSETKDDAPGGVRTYKLNVPRDPAPGTYLLQVSSGTETGMLRVVKQ